MTQASQIAMLWQHAGSAQLCLMKSFVAPNILITCLLRNIFVLFQRETQARREYFQSLAAGQESFPPILMTWKPRDLRKFRALVAGDAREETMRLRRIAAGEARQHTDELGREIQLL